MYKFNPNPNPDHWRLNFSCRNKAIEVDGCIDVNVVADKLAHYFSESSSPNIASHYHHHLLAATKSRAAELHGEFTRMRKDYCGSPFKEEYLFDVELISNIIYDLKGGKAAGLDS